MKISGPGVNSSDVKGPDGEITGRRVSGPDFYLKAKKAMAQIQMMMNTDVSLKDQSYQYGNLEKENLEKVPKTLVMSMSMQILKAQI